MPTATATCGVTPTMPPRPPTATLTPMVGTPVRVTRTPRPSKPAIPAETPFVILLPVSGGMPWMTWIALGLVVLTLASIIWWICQVRVMRQNVEQMQSRFPYKRS